jgi:hypothetical protein
VSSVVSYEQLYNLGFCVVWMQLKVKTAKRRAMPRTTTRGITEQQIREAIDQLLDDNQEPTTTRIRGVLGAGSFTTIGATLAKWRSEQDAAHQNRIPAVPDPVKKLFHRIWLEACRSADDGHEAERAGFRAEQQTWEQMRIEFTAEIARLESLVAEQLERLDEHEAAQTRHIHSLSDCEQKLAGAKGRIESLEAENSRLRGEQQRFTAQLASVAERAATAETLLSQAKASA